MKIIKNTCTVAVTALLLGMFPAQAMRPKFVQRMTSILQQQSVLRSATHKTVGIVKNFNRKHHISKMIQCFASAAALSYGLHNTVHYAYFDSQTEAYLSTKSAKEINSAWRTDNKELEDYFISLEKRYSTTHYVMYHTQPAWLDMVQDVYAILYELSEGKKVPADFRFLRFWQNPNLKDHTTVDQFITDHYDKKMFFDHECFIATALLSTSPSFFHGHNELSIVESAFAARWYKSTGFSGTSHQKTLLTDIIKHFSLDSSFVSEIMSLNDAMNSDDNVTTTALLIPKHLVNECVYLSKSFGHPYSKVIMSEGFFSRKEHPIKSDTFFNLYRNNPQAIKYLD